MLVFLFEYDYTLEESGVVTEDEHSKQAVSNRLAKAAFMACSRLAGKCIESCSIGIKISEKYVLNGTVFS